jgi:hypothetical protein
MLCKGCHETDRRAMTRPSPFAFPWSGLTPSPPILCLLFAPLQLSPATCVSLSDATEDIREAAEPKEL